MYTACDGGFLDVRGLDAGVYFDAPPVPKCIRVSPGQTVHFSNVVSNFHYPEQRCGPVAGAFTRTDDGPVTAPATAGVYGYDCGLHGSSYAGSVQVLP